MVRRQFDVFHNRIRASAKIAPYLVVLQSDLLDHYISVIAAPLQRTDTASKPSRLRPQFEVGGEVFVLNMLEMAPMLRSNLRQPIAELDRFRVIDAYDALISGAWS